MRRSPELAMRENPPVGVAAPPTASAAAPMIDDDPQGHNRPVRPADAQFDARATLAGAYDHLPVSILSQ